MNLTEAKLLSSVLSTHLSVCDSHYGELYELECDDKKRLILNILKNYLETDEDEED